MSDAVEAAGEPTTDRSTVVAGVIGTGATGARAARQLSTAQEVGSLVLDGHGDRPARLRSTLGDAVTVGDPFAAGANVLVIAGAPGSQLEVARSGLQAGMHVVSTSDDAEEVQGLLALDQLARSVNRTLVVGAAFSPGLSCVLVRHVATWMDRVDEIHTARFGTGGPACARQHHRALTKWNHDWRRGEWIQRASGSGRELQAFPDPVGSLDCYRAALPGPRLLQPAFPDAERITARQAANRRERFLAWAPMLIRPHPEGRIGAIRVEVRGLRRGASVTEVVGVLDRPAVAAGAVAGLAARWAVSGRFPSGASGLAAIVDPVPFLAELADLGTRAAVFVGHS